MDFANQAVTHLKSFTSMGFLCKKSVLFQTFPSVGSHYSSEDGSRAEAGRLACRHSSAQWFQGLCWGWESFWSKHPAATRTVTVPRCQAAGCERLGDAWGERMVQRIFPCMCFSGGSTTGVCKGWEIFLGMKHLHIWTLWLNLCGFTELETV